MVQIYSAAKKPLSASEQRTVNKIKLQSMIKEANNILARMGQVTDSPTRSITHTDAAPNAKDVPDPTGITQSKYPTPEVLRKTLKAKGLSDKAISMVVESVFPSDEARGGRILQQARYGLTMQLVNKGMPTSEALKATAMTFGEGGPGTPGTYKFSHNVGGGGTSNTILKIPGAAQTGGVAIRSASTEAAPWAVTLGLENEYQDYMRNAPTTNTKSASVSTVPREYFGEGIADMMARKADEREARHERRSRILNASSAEKYPAWMYTFDMFNEYTGVQ